MKPFPSILALSGGVGGAKFASGLSQILPSKKLTICVNTGDDFSLFGLKICPDLDTVCYTLAGRENPQTGWGLEGDSWSVLESLKSLGGPDWFQLGDKDLATHLERTRLLTDGFTLSQVTAKFCRELNIPEKILPMTDDPVETMVGTLEHGWIPFQEYFVARHCEPTVTGFKFEGASQAKPAPGLLRAIEEADFVVIGPSNPLVSINPILSIPGIKNSIQKKKIIAISPIIGGRVIKGPLAKMQTELGLTPSAATVAEQYRGLIQGFVIDHEDENLAQKLHQWDIITLVTDTVMKTREDRKRLAGQVLDFINREFSG